jgi:lipopolysaccharide export system permease protein
MIKTLRRYVFVQLCGDLPIPLVSLTLPFIIVTVIQYVQEGHGALMILRVVPFVVPAALAWTIPISLLMTCVVVFGRMSSDHELVAARARNGASGIPRSARTS